MSYSFIKNSRIYKYVSILSFHKINCWTQDISYFTAKSIISECALEALGLPITLVYAEYQSRIGFQTITDVTNLTRRSAS